MMLYTIKAKYFQYIHATDILPAIILSVLGVYIVVCVSVGGRGGGTRINGLFSSTSSTRISTSLAEQFLNSFFPFLIALIKPSAMLSKLSVHLLRS